MRERPPREPERPEVSAVPLKERLDPSSRTRRGTLPPPAGWPGEAWRYPFRGRGAIGLSLAALAFAGADALTVRNAFLGASVKVLLYATMVLWQARAAARTAAGEDLPPPLSSAASLEPDGLVGLLRLVVVSALWLAPAAVVAVVPWLENPRAPRWPRESVAAIAALFAATLCAAPIVLLAHALSSPRLAWPWRTAVWVARGFATVLAVVGGWALCAALEVLVAAVPEGAAGKAFALFLALRAAALVAVGAGARALGVLGRRFPI